jgi:hypothetical protein
MIAGGFVTPLDPSTRIEDLGFPGFGSSQGPLVHSQ